MYQLISYIKFLLKSTNHHGVHSPFVYDLVTKCFYDTKDYSVYEKITTYRIALLSNSNTIHITDFGSGSKVFSSNTRAIKEIAKTSGTSEKRARLLYRLVSHLKANNILELGTSLGMGTYAMASANSKAHITSIEGCPEISNVAKHQLANFHIENVLLKVGAFNEVLPNLDKQPYDLVFFDGHHDKEATLRYFEQLLPATHNDSVFIFDDIHWSKGMGEAWQLIKQHPSVTVSIDTFYWGFIFFRTEQVKENFVVRL